MVPQASKDDPQAQVALEESLTLNRRRSWFGSFRSVLHQGVLSAKAAVDSLRGNDINIASLAEPDSPRTSSDVLSTEGTPPKRHTGQDGKLTPKSAIASLRQNLSRHSRNSGRGSISHVFRRNGSNASSLRGPRDPGAIICEMQELSRTASPLSKNGNISKDPAASVPLPSSPINIPPPPPILKLDLGPPTMLSPFKPTESDLADIKTLQDPENITTGVSLSCLLDWHSPGQLRRGLVAAGNQLPSMEEKRMPDQRHRFKPQPLATNGPDDVFGGHLPTVVPGTCLPTGPYDSSKQQLPTHSTADCDNIDDLLRPRWMPAPEPVFESADCDLPPGYSSPIATPSNIQDGTKRESAACTDITALPTASVLLSVPSATSIAGAKAQNENVPASPDSSNESIVELNLPSPQLPINIMAAPSIPEDSDHVKLVADCVVDCNTFATAERISAQEKYRDSLAELEGNLAFEKLKFDVVQYVEQNPFVGGPGTPGSALHRSDSVKTILCSEQSDRDFVTPGIPDVATGSAAKAGLNPADGSNDNREHGKMRQDSLFSDTEQEAVHKNGPPSPERRVKLPLRPKATTSNGSSCESMMFKPILDRVAANNLNIFRPGSDPTLRQKYFPHSAVAGDNSIDHQRQPSLDSDNPAPDNISSDVAAGVFERTVEQPSPLQIRKQSNTKNIDTELSPQTPASTSTQSAPGSQTRTPSMGDRREFDRQRAERNARYSAIYSNEHDAMQDLDVALQLAEFRNAGPGFEGLTPERNREGETSDSRKTPESSVCETINADQIATARHTGKERRSILELL